MFHQPQRKKYAAVILAACAFLVCSFCEAQAHADSFKYAPDQFIVKLKDGYLPADIQELNDKFGVTSAEEVFSKPTAAKEVTRQQNPNPASAVVAHEGWFWQMEGSSDSRVGQNSIQGQPASGGALQERLAARMKNASGNAQAPRLENVFICKMNNPADILTIVSEYNNHQAVEYAEPDYFYTMPLTSADSSDTVSKAEVLAGAGCLTKQGSIVIAVVDAGGAAIHAEKNFADTDTASLLNAGFSLVKGHEYGEGGNALVNETGRIDSRGSTGSRVMLLRAGVKVIDPEGQEAGVLGNAAISRAIQYADENGADVVSLEFGGVASRTMTLALDAAFAHGVRLYTVPY